MPSDWTIQSSLPIGVFVFQGDPSEQRRENKDRLYFYVLCKPGLLGYGRAGILAEYGCNKSHELALSMGTPSVLKLGLLILELDHPLSCNRETVKKDLICNNILFKAS